MRRIQIFDTTLRDGEQAPGFSMNVDEKLTLARQLARLGVDCIEAGFAASSPEDFRGIHRIATEVGGDEGSPSIAALARCHEGDIDRAAEATRSANRPRLHVFIATSPVHMEKKLGMEPDEVLRRAVEGVKHARSLCDEVEFSAEDALRSDRSFLAEVTQAVAEAGASLVNIPDTVGYATPDEIEATFRGLAEAAPGVPLSFHGHDDLGMAVANSLAAAKAGAVQIECTINGIGERAGNAALEEIVMALETRRAFYELECGVDARQLYASSRLLGHLTGVGVQPNKAIVGANAFAHEAGIHQHGVLASPDTYEIIRPESVGRDRNDIVLGKHSGRHALKDRLGFLGLEVQPEDEDRVFARFKELASIKKRIYDEDIVLIIAETSAGQAAGQRFELGYLNVTSGSGVVPSATVIIHEGEEEHRESCIGDGPVDAVMEAVQRAVGVRVAVEDYRAQATSPGRDAVGEVTLRCLIDERTIVGRGHSTDTLEACALAAVDAVNRASAMAGLKTTVGGI